MLTTAVLFHPAKPLQPDLPACTAPGSCCPLPPLPAADILASAACSLALFCACSACLQRPVNELQQLKDNVLCSWVRPRGGKKIGLGSCYACVELDCCPLST